MTIHPLVVDFRGWYRCSEGFAAFRNRFGDTDNDPTSAGEASANTGEVK